MTDVDALLPFDFIRVSPCRRESSHGFQPWFPWAPGACRRVSAIIPSLLEKKIFSFGNKFCLPKAAGFSRKLVPQAVRASS
jgi:hypothetical protein